MKSCLSGLLVFLLSLPAAAGNELEVSAQSLRRADLPANFPFQILAEGFAVVRVTLHNLSSQETSLDLEELTVRSPKNKKIQRALPTEITPKLMKYYRGGNLDILGEAHAGPQPTPVQMQRSQEIGTRIPAGSIDVSTGARLRQILESFQLSDSPLAAGESREGYIYLKSKKTGTLLSGGRLHLGDSEAVIP